MPLVNTSEKSRNAPVAAGVQVNKPVGQTVACARVPRVPAPSCLFVTRVFSTHCVAAGMTTAAPIIDLAPCLILSAGLRLKPPNSTAVPARFTTPADGCPPMSPAYQVKVAVPPGAANWPLARLRPTGMPS